MSIPQLAFLEQGKRQTLRPDQTCTLQRLISCRPRVRQTGSRYPYAQALLESIGRALVEKRSRLTGPETQFLRKRLQNGSVIMHSHGHDGWLLRKNAVTFRTVLSASFSLLLLSSAFWPRRHADFGAIDEAFHLNAGVEFPKTNQTPLHNGLRLPRFSSSR